jgi:hypothetical protein
MEVLPSAGAMRGALLCCLLIQSRSGANEPRECTSHPLDESVVPVFAAGQYQSRMPARMAALSHNPR